MMAFALSATARFGIRGYPDHATIQLHRDWCFDRKLAWTAWQNAKVKIRLLGTRF